MQRFLWIDYVKFLGIFIIVYSHLPASKIVTNFIFTFNVPLFFFVSGFLSAKKDNNLDIRKKVERLLLPYIYIYFISVFVSYTIKAVETQQINFFNFGQSLIGFLWGTHSYKYFINSPLWFLPSLLTVELIFGFFNNKWRWLLLSFPVISILLYTRGVLDTFLSFDLSLLGLNYYYLGYLSRKYNLDDWLQKRPKSILALTAIATFLIVLFLAKNNNVWYRGNSLGDYFISFLGGAIGCLMITTISLLLEQTLGRLDLVTYISQNTLLILGFHLFTNKFSYPLISLLKFVPDKSKSLLAAILSIVMLVPVIFLINKFYPQIGGRSQKLTLGEK